MVEINGQMAGSVSCKFMTAWAGKVGNILQCVCRLEFIQSPSDEPGSLWAMSLDKGLLAVALFLKFLCFE